MIKEYPEVKNAITEITLGPSTEKGELARFSYSKYDRSGKIVITRLGLNTSYSKDIILAGRHEAFHALDFELTYQKYGVGDTSISEEIVNKAINNLGLRKNEARDISESFIPLEHRATEGKKPYEVFAYGMATKQNIKDNDYLSKLSNAFMEYYKEVFES